MAPRPDPEWDVQTHLCGLPYTNWKKRTGYEMRGTLAQCIERFLGLPFHHQINCTLSWTGPVSGTLEADGIRRLIERKGVPPAIASERRISAERLEQMMTKPAEDFRPRRQPFNDAAPLGAGPRQAKS